MSPPDTNATNSNSKLSSEHKSTNTFDLTKLTEIITEIITEQNRVRNNFRQDIDQTIDDQYKGNLTDLDKIPDIVKCIREFSGQPGEFGSWKKSVERILQIYEHLEGTPKYYGILNVIRNKIVGHADVALESYNTPLNWQKIAKCLTLHYADKRDLGTLEYQMMTLVQGNQTIQEFYQRVYQHLSLILNKLSSMDMGQESMNNLTENYRDKALDTFIRGLKGDLPRLLSIRGPSDLPQALQLCLKLQNMDYRAQYANHSAQTIQRKPPIPPPLFIRKNQIPMSAQPFFPQLLHNPQTSFERAKIFQPDRYQFGYQNPQFPRVQNQPFRPQFGHQNYPAAYPPKPQPKPTPMSVDGSGQSRHVNYMNRPQNIRQPMKRPLLNSSQQHHHPNKAQRIYHYEQFGEDPTTQHYQDYQEELAEYDSQYEQTLVEYTDAENIPELKEDYPTEVYEEEEISEQLDDINFLD